MVFETGKRKIVKIRIVYRDKGNTGEDWLGDPLEPLEDLEEPLELGCILPIDDAGEHTNLREGAYQVTGKSFKKVERGYEETIFLTRLGGGYCPSKRRFED